MSNSARTFALPVLLLALVVALIALGTLNASPANVTSVEVLAAPSYSELEPPPAGQVYVDPVFGTPILRVTDAVDTEDTLAGGNLEFAVNEYSSVTPFNADSSLVLLIHESVFALYDTAGHFLRVLPEEVHARSEPRWSLTDPSVFYFLHDNELRSFNVATGEESVVRRFSEYHQIGGRGETDISTDGDHLALVGDDRDVFRYEISTNTKGRTLDTSRIGSFDQVMVTPDNQVLIGWRSKGVGRGRGLELFDPDMNFMWQISQATGHMDVARDNDGGQIVIRTNADDPNPICDNGVVKIRLGDLTQTCLLSLDWGLAVHISAPGEMPWFFVSTYAPDDPRPGDPGWTVYANEILRVMIDGSGVERLAHHRSRPWNDYNYEPRASASRDGARLLYSSNFSLQSLLGYDAEYSDVYMIGSDVPPPPPPRRPRHPKRGG
jgi:hypothetical protein